MWKILLFVATLNIVFIVTQAQDFCIQCNSTLDHRECLEPESSDFNVSCGSASRNRSCYSRVVENGFVERGCLGRLDNETAANCDSETCKICVGDFQQQGCNHGLFPAYRLSCHICTGGENSTCAGRTNTTKTVCPIFHADDQCYIARPNGNYERGCLSSSPSRCDIEGTCFQCSGVGCNFFDYSSAVNVHSSVKFISFALASIALMMFNN